MSADFHTTGLAKRATVEELVRQWNLAMHELRTGLDSLGRAEEHLKAFDTCGSSWDLHLFRHDDTTMDFEKKRKRLKAAAWRYLVDRIELKKLASIARAKEIDKQLHERPDELPDITMDNIFGWLDLMAREGANFLKEAAVEVFEMLRPASMHYKTNSGFKVGRRVILSGRVERAWTGRSFRVSYHFADDLRALDNVFHMLDGNGVSAYRQGDLATAIEASKDGSGETPYFGFRCFINRNLHLEFKRPDLVQRLNELGGNGLPMPNERRTA